MFQNLGHLTEKDILTRTVPLPQLLEGSLYYPASGFDGEPIRRCNTDLRTLGINCFVYCDYLSTEKELVRELRSVRGYHVLAHRSLAREEYVPDGFSVDLAPHERGRYRETFGNKHEPRPFAHWTVFERDSIMGEDHGPERFSLLYIGGEGLATFQMLYCTRRLRPKMMCFIRCWGFAGNWTDFTSPRGPFFRTLLRHPESVPDWIWVGNGDDRAGVCYMGEERGNGICRKAYVTASEFRLRYGSGVLTGFQEGDEDVILIRKVGRRYLAIRFTSQMGYLIYDVTNAVGSPDETLRRILMDG